MTNDKKQRHFKQLRHVIKWIRLITDKMRHVTSAMLTWFPGFPFSPFSPLAPGGPLRETWRWWEKVINAQTCMTLMRPYFNTATHMIANRALLEKSLRKRLLPFSLGQWCLGVLERLWVPKRLPNLFYQEGPSPPVQNQINKYMSCTSIPRS